MMRRERTLKKTSAFILILAVWAYAGWGQEEPFCPQIANYSMDITLNTDSHTLTGTEILEWTNNSQVETSELWFHLYWNAFQNNKSDFLTEGRDRWGRIIGVVWVTPSDCQECPRTLDAGLSQLTRGLA